MADLSTIFSWFETGDIPTQNQFQQTFSSFRHKDENIAINNITGLETALNNKLGSAHATDANAHNNVLAKLDASNLNYANTEAWRLALGVGDIPDNVALVDIGEAQEVYNKMQIHNMSMMLADFVTAGKIRADKIESLGITDLVEASETSLAAFVGNSGNYEFQQNDFIAIPVNGNFSLFLFKGGDKTVAGNYLATGLTNITIAMVAGLQDALNTKIDKPAVDGSWFTRKVGSNVTQRQINPSVAYLTLWNGNDFAASPIYSDGVKLGVGTISPSEQLHLSGRARMSALVLADNAETLPQQLTYNNRTFYGTNDVGAKRAFMFADYADFNRVISMFTQAECSNIANILGGGTGSPGNPSVNLISPPLVQNQYNVNEYILLRGANLNLGIGRKVEILAANKTTVIAVIPDNQIQTYDDGLSLIFFYNFSTFTEGQYFIRLTSGVKVYITSLDLSIIQQVQNIDLSTIGWDFVYAAGVAALPNDTANSGNFTIETQNGSSVTPKTSLKSSEIFAQGDDFLIELTINLSPKPQGVAVNRSFIGIGYSSTQNSTSVASQINMGYDSSFSAPNIYIYNNNNNIGLFTTPNQFVVTFIKTGNVFRTIIGSSSNIVTLSNNQGYSVFIQIVGQNYNGYPAQIVNGQITKAFKFN